VTERFDLPPVSPGGAEYTLMAVRVAGITAATRCLTIGRGHTPAALTLAQHLGCHVTGLSRSPDRARTAQAMAEAAGRQGRQA